MQVALQLVMPLKTRREIMRTYSLISNYTIAKYKVHKSKCNEDKTPNVVNREFDNRDKFEVILSDLTYVRVGARWSYVCALLDLHNKEVLVTQLVIKSMPPWSMKHF